MTSKHSASQQLISTNLFDALNSFDEIEARISALPGNKERGDAFEIFAEAYFATQKITQAQQVWPFEAVPLEQRQLLSLDTGRDMGVDGTYLTVDGELRAYQVKFRSNRAALTWDELSTFMGLTDQVSQRVLFTNSESLPKLMQDRSGFVAIRGSDLDRLTAEDFVAMRQWLHSGKIALPRKQPRAHQQEALTAIAQGLGDNERATVVMACGTGKSLVALWAAEQQNCKKILVLVPSLALVRQLLHEWLRETAWDQLTFMCVCSDPTVTKGADDLIVRQADLDFPVATDSAIVSKFLSKPFDGVKIVFSTYQSAHVVAAGMLLDAQGIKQPFDLGVFDEAHKTAGRAGTRFSFALEDTNLPISKRLFFTATPRHYDIRKKDKEGDNKLVYSMDKPEVYGPVVHTLSFAEAARRDIICDYKVVISVVTSDMVNDHLLKCGEVIVDGDTVKAHQVALQIALHKAVEQYGVSRIFTFHGSVAAARSFTSDDGDGIRSHLPDFTTLHVSGKMRTSLREDHMKSFRHADKAVMSNARCLTEGVDVPAVDMVAFISPRKSKVDIVQATGRAMRKSDATGKQFGYVLVPLFVEQAANETIEEALRRTRFADVWDLLGAMREQDDVLTDIIRQMREDKGRTGDFDASQFSKRVEVLGPIVSLDTIRGSITAECVESLGVSWDERFGELVAYKTKHGHINVNHDCGSILLTWVGTQRKNKKAGTLSGKKKSRLDEIGFVWNVHETAWKEMFEELLAYKTQYGTLEVPANQTRLGCWVANQRQMNKTGKISSKKKKQLETIGFQWSINDSRWEIYFCELITYKEEHGDVDVPQHWDTGLGLWVSTQRQALKNEVLTLERKKRLEEIGFTLDPLEKAWEMRFNELVDYQGEHGDVDVPQHWGTGLGLWVSTQRQALKNGALSSKRNKQLLDIGLKLELYEKAWEVKYNELVAYKAANGDIKIPKGYLTGLDAWVVTQRQNKKKNKLTLDQIKRLEEVGFVWDPSKKEWDVKFNELVAYKTEYGNIIVPSKDPEGLNQWILRQRQNMKRGKLLPERFTLLDDIGFIWDPREEAWEANFNKMAAYRDEHGDIMVPRNYPNGLGVWIKGQRAKKESLLAEQKARLEAFPGWVWKKGGSDDECR